MASRCQGRKLSSPKLERKTSSTSYGMGNAFESPIGRANATVACSQRIGSGGGAAAIETPAPGRGGTMPPMGTIPRFFLDRVAASGPTRAWSAYADGAWQDATWDEYAGRARAFGLGLVAAGLKRGDAVAILGPTGPEWAFCDVGVIGAGGVSVGLYPTLAPEGVGSVEYVTNHCEARVLVVDSTATLKAKVAPILGRLPRVERIVVWRCDDEARALDRRVESLADVLARGEALHAKEPGAWRDACLAAKPEDVAVLVYTSGTTGQPKGAMITHRNIEAQSDALIAMLPWRAGDSGLSFLPMAHVAEHCMVHYTRIRLGQPTHYARSLETLLDDFAVARPTQFGSVPRIFEKVFQGVRAEMAKLEPPMRAMAEKVYAAGLEAARAKREGREVPADVAPLAAIFDQQLGAKVRARFGGRCTRLTSGAAPIAVEILELFDACGMPAYELYGLTETTGMVTSNAPGATKLGTVGRASPGVEVRIADDGEILVRGATVFAGYFKDAQASGEALEGGWLHTGDIGKLDAD